MTWHRVYAPGPPGELNTWCGRNCLISDGTADDGPDGPGPAGLQCSPCNYLRTKARLDAEQAARDRGPDVCSECGRPLDPEDES